MIRGWNPMTLVVALLVAVFFCSVGLMIRRRLLDWRAARVAPRTKPPPPRPSPNQNQPFP